MSFTSPYLTVNNKTELQLQELQTQIAYALTQGFASLRLSDSVQFWDNTFQTLLGKVKYDTDTSTIQYSTDGGVTWQSLGADVYTWSSTKTYTSGAVVLYQTGWYACIAATSTGNVPSSSTAWTLLTLGTAVKYVGTTAQFTHALQTATTGTTIVVKADLSGQISAVVPATRLTIWSDEQTSFTGALTQTLPSGGVVYWHSNGLRITGSSSMTVAVGTLYIDRFGAYDSVSSMPITFTGTVYYQAPQNCTVTGGTQKNWTIPQTSDLYVAKDLTAYTRAEYTDNMKLYADCSGVARYVLGSDLAYRAATLAPKYIHIDNTGLLANRPSSATLGYSYFATDTGDLYIMGYPLYIAESASTTKYLRDTSKDCKNSSNVNVYGWTSTTTPVATVYTAISIPTVGSTVAYTDTSLTVAAFTTGVYENTTTLHWGLPIHIQGQTGSAGVGYTLMPAVNASTGVISWTVETPSSPPTPPTSVNIKGPQGASAMDTWKSAQSSAPTTETELRDMFLASLGVGNMKQDFTNYALQESQLILQSAYPFIGIRDNDGNHWTLADGRVQYIGTSVTINLQDILEAKNLAAHLNVLYTVDASTAMQQYYRNTLLDSGSSYGWTCSTATEINLWTANPSPSAGATLYTNSTLTTASTSTLSSYAAQTPITGTWSALFGGGGGYMVDSVISELELTTASTPAVVEQLATVTCNSVIYTRSASDDYAQKPAYAWKSGSTLLYTATCTIAVGETVLYTDTAQTTQAGIASAYTDGSNGLSHRVYKLQIPSAAVRPMEMRATLSSASDTVTLSGQVYITHVVAPSGHIYGYKDKTATWSGNATTLSMTDYVTGESGTFGGQWTIAYTQKPA